MLRLSVGLPVDRPEHLTAAAAAIEAAGFDACFVTDHPFPPARWLARGGHTTQDPFVALAFAAAATSRLRLHTNCLIPAYRNPFTTAKAIASLDVLSGGRVILGVAAGYLEGEFVGLGIPFRERGRLLDTSLDDFRAAWEGETAAGNVIVPGPVQRPHPPIWIGGNSRTAVRRAVARGDGWAPFPAPPSVAAAVRTVHLSSVEALGQAIDDARAEWARAGRSGVLDVCFTPFTHPMGRADVNGDELLAEAQALEAAGVTWLALSFPAPSLATFVDHVASVGRLLRG
jgi:probable F420-dependent oxidoreductase